MPDEYGFNLLGVEVACIDCDFRGPTWQITEKLRAKHQAEHVRDGQTAAQRAARDRARTARRLARQKDRENAIAYKEDA